MPAAIQSAALIPHPSTASDVVSSIAARAAWTGTGALAIAYIVAGNVDRLRIPQLGPAKRTDDLWRHTCFEIFIPARNGTAYYEMNFSPSGAWTLYSFERYRERAAVEKVAAPEIAVRRHTDRFELDARIDIDSLGRIDKSSRLRIGLATVVEDGTGALSYWSLHHPAGKPDFHHPDNFLFDLDPLPEIIAAARMGKS